MGLWAYGYRGQLNSIAFEYPLASKLNSLRLSLLNSRGDPIYYFNN